MLVLDHNRWKAKIRGIGVTVISRVKRDGCEL